MPVIVVANPKGGVGKSTLATNLAGYLAAQGHAVMLGDTDRQQSSRAWLDLRPPGLRSIATWDVDHNEIARPPKGTTHAVLDTPASLHGKRLDSILKLADHVLVPLQPSIFDILATRDFLQTLGEVRAVRQGDVRIGVVGMRVDARTRAADQLSRYCEEAGLPVLGMLRNTQNYVQLAAHGLTLWDVAPGRVERDLPQWEGITAFIASR